MKSGATPAFDLILWSQLWYSLQHRRYWKKFPPCICRRPCSSCSALSWWTVLDTGYYFKLLQKGRSFWVKFISLSHSVCITFHIIMPFCKSCHMPFHKAPFHSFTLLLQRRQKEADFQLLPVPHTVLSISFIQQIRPLENDVRKFEL